MSSFQFGSYTFGMLWLGGAVADLSHGFYGYAAVSAAIGIVALIATGFASAAGGSSDEP